MANKPHKYKDRDIKRVVKAARASGVAVNVVKVNPNTGEIVVMSSPNCLGEGTEQNSWDEVLHAEDKERAP